MNIFHNNNDNKINDENIRKDWAAVGVWLLTTEKNCSLNSSGGTEGWGQATVFLIK